MQILHRGNMLLKVLKGITFGLELHRAASAPHPILTRPVTVEVKPPGTATAKTCGVVNFTPISAEHPLFLILQMRMDRHASTLSALLLGITPAVGLPLLIDLGLKAMPAGADR